MKPEFSHFKETENYLEDEVKAYFKTWIERINNEQIASDKNLQKRSKKLKEDIIDIEE